jgi:thiol:disulfide interchange protein DsbD
MSRYARLALLCLTALAGTAHVQAAEPAGGGNLNVLLSNSNNSSEFLPVEKAFDLRATADGPDRVRLDWVIAPGYYLYQSRLKFSSPSTEATLGAPELPAGDVKNDEFFGKQVVYHHELTVRLAVARAAGTALEFPLTVTYQGCAEAGLCYPPQTRNLTISLPSASAGAGGASAPATGYVSKQDWMVSLIRSGNLFYMLAVAFAFGLGLAFTPCVLPMVPILSGLIVGSGERVSTGRAFLLSLVYVLGMAITYTAAGAATAAAGSQVQAMFQQPWIILLFSAIFVAMALSMFGLYTVQMPAFIQTRLANASNRQQSGSFTGVAIMGALSALIVTTCVGPVLVAALVVIGKSGAISRGAAALFAMSLGMGAPLLVIGTSAGKLLPKPGMWMDAIKRLFGVLMLGVAAWMLSRLLSDRVSLLLFALPLIAALVVLWQFPGRTFGKSIARVAALACAVYAALLVNGYRIGASDPLAPLRGPIASSASTGSSAPNGPAFRDIHSVADLDREVKAAAAQGHAVMLDFYADWCTSCKEMERYTFTDTEVRQALGSIVLLRADVTANNDADKALLARFNVIGPPTIAFYDAAGQEQSALRVVGYMKAPEFAALLHQLVPATAALATGGK